MTEREKLDKQELALLDVARLGLLGDVRSLEQKVRNLSRGGRNAPFSPQAREELRRILGGQSVGDPRRLSERSELETPFHGTSIPEREDEIPPVLEPQLAEHIELLVREYESKHLLEEANLKPSTRVLLTGPPGTGKTMTARWIASRLCLPLNLVEPAQVLSSLMGESARNLTKLIREGTSVPSVIFLDELDAYARHRGEINDMGEPKRIVNTLLLELDHWPDHSLLIAATNHLESIDVAVRRRFEMTLSFSNPKVSARKAIVQGVLGAAHRELDPKLLDAIASGTRNLNASSLTNATTAALRRSIIDEVDLPSAVAQQFFSPRYLGRSLAARKIREEFALTLVQDGWSVETVANLLGVSTDSVGKTLSQ